MHIRSADPRTDAAACAEIYAPFVTGSAASFEETAPEPEQFAQRIERFGATHAWLVAIRDRDVLGYAYGAPHRERAAYRWATDVTVYVASQAQRGGIGRALYDQLLARLADQGFYIACAGITLPNQASVALHRVCGFELVGIYRRIGWKAGAWRDVAWWQRDLRPPADEPPLEPSPG
ncbi:MAG: GNAT family N-acetyltransferase [Solirubrobacteraceae bacterium]